MTLNKAIRRTHLYLAMFLVAWFSMYGLSTIPMNHANFGKLYDDGVPAYKIRFEREYHIDIPPEADLRNTAARILGDAGLEGEGFDVLWKNNRELLIYTFGFWSSHELSYFPDDNWLVARDMRFRWDYTLGNLHATVGYGKGRLVDDVWAFIVDIVVIAFLLWAATGLYMWWKHGKARITGIAALGAGIATMVMFLLTL